MRRRWMVALCVVIACGGSVNAAEDVTGAKLAKATEGYVAEISDARQAVLDKYQEVVKALAADEKVDQSFKVRDEMKVFASDDLMCGRAAMKEVFLAYAGAKQTGRERLGKAFEQAIKDYLIAGDLDKADELRAKLAKLPLIGRLVSLENVKRRGHFLQHGDYTARGAE